ncbi:MAG TPA: MMPL family transporter, partial [Solirubrobacteraceae bacterium]|nr:MMPL family transporter [Solirubrobacteraceae bacterium]
MLERLVAFAVRRPVAVIGVTVLLALVGGLYALRLDPSTGAETLVGTGSEAYEATETYYERFGDDAVIVLVREPLTKLVLTRDLGQLLKLEGCLGGNVPVNAEPYGGEGSPCARLARDKPARVVFGPATFVNESVRQLTKEFIKQSREASRRAGRAARAARKLAKARGWSQERTQAAANAARQAVNAEFTRDILRLALRYGITGEPRIDDPNFVSKLVFDATKPSGTPKARFAYLFPTSRAALVQVRLKDGLSDAERAEAIRNIRAATKMDEFKLADGTYTVTGVPAVLTELADEVGDSIRVLLFVALVVMAIVLLLVFRVRPSLRLLPLAIALIAVALTFGGLSLAGVSLTMASIAVLPVLIGLAVDYAI